MPTLTTEKIDEAIFRLRGIPRPYFVAGGPEFHTQITTTIGEIDHACRQHQPFYWEGVARLFMAEGDLYYDIDRPRALTAYEMALVNLTVFPFRDETVNEQEGLIERALWARFVLAYTLGYRELAIAAARPALDGVFYAIDEENPRDRMVYWGQRGPIKVTASWKRLILRTYLLGTIHRVTTPTLNDRQHSTTN